MFECKKCGECCFGYSIPVAHLHIDQEEFLKARGFKLNSTPLGMYLISSDRCPHLTAENLCDIYDTRPKICRRHQCEK